MRVAELRGGPAEGLLEQPEGVFEVEAAEVGLPQSVHMRRCRARVAERAGRPQPHRFRVMVAGEPLHGETDQRPFQDGQVADVVQPRGPVGQPGMQPVPADRDSGAVAGGFGRRDDRRVGPGFGIGEPELLAVLGRTASSTVVRAWFAG